MSQEKGLVAITGGSRGIGLAIALRFAKERYPIAICARDTQNLQAAKHQLEQAGSPQVLIKQTNAALKEDIEAFGKAVIQTGLPIAVLVHNAGVFRPGSIGEEDAEAFNLQMNTNVASAYHLTRLLMDKIKADRTHIFTMCSTASITAYINGGSYCISKFALLGFTKVLREELKLHKARVTAILPGATLTDSWAGADIPPERFIKASDVAEAVFTCHKLSPQTVVEELLIRPQEGDL